ncbi:MAG: phosphonate ABC transporter, permease protein PhnE [Cytophagales bacterium]|nr:phosphonate ABC transporter, permease protein PhnE [Cytophagales bacterium]
MKTIKALIIDLLIVLYNVTVIDRVIIPLCNQSNDISEYSANIFFIHFLIAAAVTAAMYFVPSASPGKRWEKLYSLNYGTPWYVLPYSYIGIITIILTLITGFVVSQVSFKEFFSQDGIEGAQRIFMALFTPNFNIFYKVITAAIETIYMALIATFFAIPVAFLLSFFAARNLMKSSAATALYVFIRTMLNVSRSIEPLVWAIIFSVWVGIGPFAGMLALMIHSVASLTKLYSEQIEDIDEGPVEAMKAVGASNILVVWYGIVPQLINPFLSYTIYRWDINVRMATIIGMVGGGGIGNMLMQYQGLAKWHEVGMVILVIAVVVWVMDFASAKLRSALSN